MARRVASASRWAFTKARAGCGKISWVAAAHFGHFYCRRARQVFTQQLALVNDDEFAFAINDVRPSLIRTESDETTYNLHVMLRFDLERQLLSGSLSTSDLPAAWNERVKTDFGLTVPDDARGCLQVYSLGGRGGRIFSDICARELLRIAVF